MKNKDTLQAEKTAILQKFSDAIKADDQEGFASAFSELAENIQASVMDEYKQQTQINDTAVLASRGVRQLTSAENKYYTDMVEAMKSSNPKQAVTLIDDVLPKTTIDTIFSELTEAHPLLDAINFQNTGLLTEILVSTTGGVAVWGEVTATITAELTGTFAVIPLGINKLSAFIPVAKAMLDLGPAWLDNYVRTLLGEALVVQLEAGIVDGDGKLKPLGMTRSLTGATDGVYPRKAPIPITKLDPATFGTIANTLSVGRSGKRRAVPKILMVVNPTDYYTKVFPATTPRAIDGSYTYDVFPYPVLKVVSPAVPEGYAVFGLAKQYFFGLGNSKGGKLEFSDEYKFLEDVRTYLIKLYGNGQPLLENDFIYADITGLNPAQIDVVVTNYEQTLKPLILTSTASATVIGKTVIDVAQSINAGNTYKYKTAATITLPLFNNVLTTGWTVWNGTAEIVATTGNKIVIAEVDADNKAKAAGEATVTSKDA